MHPQTAIYSRRANAASYSRRSTLGPFREIRPSFLQRAESLASGESVKLGILANLKRRISLPHEPSPWQPLLLDSSAARSCRANKEAESRYRRLRRLQPEKQLHLPSTAY